MGVGFNNDSYDDSYDDPYEQFIKESQEEFTKEIGDYDTQIEKLKKSSEERVKLKKEEEKQLKKLAEKKTSKEEQEQLQKKVEESKQIYIIDVWKDFFTKISKDNEIPGQCILHLLIGQALSNIRIPQNNGTYLDHRLNFFWLQESGSGKGAAIWVLKQITEHLKKIRYISKTSPKIRYNIDGEPYADNMKVVKASGGQTDAAWLDDLEVKKGKVTDNVIPGIMSTSDIVYWEEAIDLLDTGSWNEKLQTIVLSMMEPIGSPQNTYPKQLKGFGRSVDTTSTASFFATTRPLTTIKKAVLDSGELQRMVCYVKELSHDERISMIDKSTAESFKNPNLTNTYDFERKAKEIALELNKIIEFAVKNPLSILPEEYSELISFMMEKMRYFFEKTYNEVPNPEHVKILESFISRYRNHMIVIAYHSAIMRYSKYLQKQDIEYAFLLLKELFDSLVNWIGITIVDDTRRDANVDRRNLIKKVIKDNNNSIRRKDLVIELINECGVTEGAAYSIIKRLVEGKHSMLEEKDGMLRIRKK